MTPLERGSRDAREVRTKSSTTFFQQKPGTYVLDKVPGIDTLPQDLRDDETGRLDAKKMGGVVSGFGSGDREGGWDYPAGAR